MHVSGHIRKRNTQSKEPCYQLVLELPLDKSTGQRKRIYHTVHATKKVAEQLLHNMIYDYENQSYIKKTDLSVSEWMDDWYSLYSKEFLSPTTLQSYKYNIEHYIKPSNLGHLSIQDVSSADVQDWINELYNQSPVSGKALKPKTVKNIYHNLSAAFDKAVENELIKKNVCKKVRLPKPEKYHAEVYDENEVKQLLNAIDGTDMMLPITLDLILGLRRGELLGLKWHHIDFEKKIITIEDNLVEVNKDIDKNRTLTKKPKSTSGERKIPITDSTVELLKKGRREYLTSKIALGEKFHDGDFVVCQPNGEPYKPASFSKKFRNLLEKNNLKHIRLHDIRHTNATLMLSHGVSPKVAQMRLGHSDFSTTMNIYSHVLESMEVSAAKAIEDTLFPLHG